MYKIQKKNYCDRIRTWVSRIMKRELSKFEEKIMDKIDTVGLRQSNS